MNNQHHEAVQARSSIQYLLAHSADGARPWPAEASLSALNSVEIRARGWVPEALALPLHVVLTRFAAVSCGPVIGGAGACGTEGQVAEFSPKTCSKEACGDAPCYLDEWTIGALLSN